MDCQYSDKCGGCTHLHLDEPIYKKDKLDKFKQMLSDLNQSDITYGESIFIPHSTRRRASFTFSYNKDFLNLGFNERASHNIVNVENCQLLTPLINKNIVTIKNLVNEICKTPIVEKIKKGKIKTLNITSGDILVCEADNGLDIVIEIKETLSLDHRMIISELLSANKDIIRLSHRKTMADVAEPIYEEAKPSIKISGIDVFVSAGTFLQASKEGEKALVDLVLRYANQENHKNTIADLFCGVGTFSYPLSKNKNNKILAIDSSKDLLDGFKRSINKNMITNIELSQKNLFKYPLDENELEGFNIVIIDPPRAGASAQFEKIANMENDKKPQTVIAVSCNPHSFVKDANVLTSSGYKIEELTFVDQFTYSNHCELVALFTKQS